MTDIAFQWMPQSYMALGSVDNGKQLVLSWFFLEAAINTYTDPVSGHKVFDSDTDLNYPPDRRRFLNYMGESSVKSLKYAARLIEVTAIYVEIPDMEKEMISLAHKAAQTDFKFLSKKR